MDFGTKSIPIEIAPGETLTGEILVRPLSPCRIQSSCQFFVESRGALYIEQIPLDLTIQEGEMPETWRKQMEELQAQQENSTDENSTDGALSNEEAKEPVN